LDGRYRLSDRLAYGGMGEVWRATDEVLSREVAVKILRPELAEDEAFVRRFRAEARTTSGLPHNGIAAVYDYGETRVGADGQSPAPYEDQDADPVAYLVMELVPGEALSSILSREGALGTERTLDLVAQAARALHAAHLRGVIHRDIKPANLMVTPDGRVKVTDFGIARPLDHEPLTATGQVMGTAHYLAPELAKGQDASPLSDVYALGVVAYECLAGHRPFEGDNQVAVALAHLNEQPPPLPGTISPQVRAVVGAAMEKDPNRRMPSAEAFAAALETLRYRQPGEEHLTPGTGIIPGGAAFRGLDAAGLLEGPPEHRGWTPGAHGGREGAPQPAMAPQPVPAAVPPPGTQIYGPSPTRGGMTGGMAAGAMTGGMMGRGDGGYGGPPDPFRTPTAPGGMPLTPGRRERPRRSVGGPVIIGAALGTLAVIVLIIIYLSSSGGGNTPLDTGPGPATTTSAPSLAPTTASKSPTSRTTRTTRNQPRTTTLKPTTVTPSSQVTPTSSVTPPRTTSTSRDDDGNTGGDDDPPSSSSSTSSTPPTTTTSTAPASVPVTPSATATGAATGGAAGGPLGGAGAGAP
jgi:serine/threonine-protein kinase